MRKLIFITSLVFLLTLAVSGTADGLGEKRNFYIEPSYDLSEREEITAVLVKITPKIYFYVDESWWNFTPQNEILQSLTELAEEFENNIYPALTSTFGPEWNPGIDKDSRLTVLIHPMRKEVGGCFRAKDEYSKIQVPDSNQREMVYLNSEHIRTPLVKSFLAHEFIHLITFNQKDNTYNLSEETWLNEARAEYAPTLIGYDDDYQGSNLERRVQIFSDSPSNSLIEWQNKKEDYSSIAIFTQYLVDHYGLEILVDSLRSPKVGMESLNYALEKNGFKKDFSQIFLDWVIAVLINDCNYGSNYCFLNKNLRNLYVVAQTNFLPLTGESTLTIGDLTKSWTGNWYKIIGGQGNLKLEFISRSSDYFTVPYLTKNRSGNYIIDFLKIEDSQKGEIYIEEFGEDIISLFIIPIVNKQNNQNFYSFSWSVSVAKNQEESELIKQLLAQIENLTAEISRVQAEIDAILAVKGQIDKKIQGIQSCKKIENNLRYGLMDNQEVRCLQEFLKSQGKDIYPQGLVTGNFLSLTKTAVIRFQEKYAKEILTTWGIDRGTGFVGRTTRAKINEILER